MKCWAVPKIYKTAAAPRRCSAGGPAAPVKIWGSRWNMPPIGRGRYIERQPHKYETFLKQAGSSLSHGQRQLMSIARAVLANPRILILDEATSSVDTRTEKEIQDAMVRLMKNRTSLIIAHRLSTIRDADKIVVMDQGRVAETGSHEALLARKGKYYELYMTQFAGNQI